MLDVIKPAKFLKLINQACKEEVKRNARFRDKSQRMFRPYKFSQKIDLVILGPCSAGYLWFDGRSTSGLMLGSNPDWVDGKHADVFAPHLKELGKGTVLLISDCCGRYSKQFEETIKRKYPDVTWLLPQTGDYCGNIKYYRLGRDLHGSVLEE